MKNLIIFISPKGTFFDPRPELKNDSVQLSKVQIDNSLRMAWKKEDILFFTNFEYQYGDFKATVLKDVDFFERKPQASKINAICKLFELGHIKKNEIYWFHDLDAFQQEIVLSTDVKIKNSEIALTDFGKAKRFRGVSRWNTSSIFFKFGSRDIFEKIKEIYYDKKCDEEEAFQILISSDTKIKKRVKKINSTYSYNGFGFKSSYKEAEKPIKVLHFHPLVEIKKLGVSRSVDFFIPLMTERLRRILRYHKLL